MSSSQRQRGSALWVVIVLIAALIATLTLTDVGDGFFGEEIEPIAGSPVQRGPLRISVIERGNLEAADAVILRSEVEGRTTILSLVDEGTWVEPGDLVCELDTAELIERRVSQEITVQNAEAAYIKAQQNHEIQLSANRSDIARAERNLSFADLDRAKYLEGDYPQELQRREEEILLADEELTRAAQDLTWSEKLAEQGFLESTQLDADRLAKNRAEITLNQKQRALELLKQYEHPRQLEELEADVEEMGRELERVRLQADAKLVDFEAARRTSKARYDLEAEKLTKLDEQIAKARMVAPAAGMIVYHREESRRGSSEVIEEGIEVRERQEIVTIPSTRGMVAGAALHESVMGKVQVDMSCIVTVDAVPDRTFRGRVSSKAVLPDQNSWLANPDLRVYRTEVELLDSDPRVRPGMSCSIEILVDDLEDALFIPLQAVFLDGGDPIAFVSTEGGPERRPLEVGQSNVKWVEVRSGLSEGDVVLLSQPPGFNLRPAPDGGTERAEREGAKSREGRPEKGRGRPEGSPNGERGERSGKASGAGSRSGGRPSSP